MSDSHNEVKTLEERYEILQSLFKQQIMLNETLKSELTRLGSLYRKVSLERDLLLSHITENQELCVPGLVNFNSDSPNRCASPNREVNKRSTNVRYPSPIPPKKLKLNDEKSISSHLPDNGIAVCSENLPNIDRVSYSNPSTAPSRCIAVDKTSITDTHAAVGRSQFSRLQNMVSQLNSPVYSSTVDPSSGRSLDSPRNDSPPPITVTGSSASQQRPVKSASLLSNSSLSGSVSLSINKNASSGIQFTKGASLSNNRIGSSSLVNRHSLPINLLRHPNNRPTNATTTQLSNPRSPQATSPLRMPGSAAGGPRILIQPSSTNVRPVLLQATESLSGLSEENR